jgi:hypothetical protein
MLKADPKRIAWFLSLQRIFHFPKFFMAPQTRSRQRRGLATSDQETTGRGHWLSQNERATSGRSSSHPALSLPMLNQATFPILGSGTANIRRAVGVAAAASPSNFSKWQTASNLALIAKMGRNIEKHAWHHSIVRQEPSTLKERNRLIAGSSDPGFRSKKSGPLAPTSVASLEQRVGEFEPYPDQNAVASGSREVAFGTPHLLPSEQPTSSQGYVGQYQSPLSGRDETADSDQFQRPRPAVSTLHIDGAALGRWTVQHLERALGKPATGMTGVDPRSTIPRSRVAPF